ncbi:DUF2341 domain-containing protein [Ralstonia sp.]|uniref:DUF2341 domain-containing protein n=1 Tax=Ralstonia sp. TaxID=54061 RepID=UPI0031D9557D
MRRILFLLTLLSVFLPGTALAWWQPDWAYRKPITIDAGPQGGALKSDAGRTPVLVRLHTGNFSFDGTSENGADLRFIAGDDKTVLNHQIEQFDPLLGIALVWVDVPTVATGAPQHIWMYYGNRKAPAAGNGQLTFDPDYTLVYHFGETGAPPRDTTAYGNHAQTPVTTLDGAVIGKGAQFNGAPLMLPASPSLTTQANGTFTVSAWVRPEKLAAGQVIYARRDAANEFVLGVDNGVPFVQVNGQRSAPGQPVRDGQWSHVAATADEQGVHLYVNGAGAATLAAHMPALNSAAAVGGDAPGGSGLNPFSGAIDELRLSKTARPAGLIQADAIAQGAESRLVVMGPDEKQAGKSHFGFILAAMPVDAWVVVCVLGLMMAGSWAIMITKSRYYSAVSRANARFMAVFRETAGASLDSLVRGGKVGADVRQDSSLWRLYEIAIREMQLRHERGFDINAVSAATIAAIRAAMEGVMVRENERMARRMNWLSTTIEGAPYVGLFGTVIGIMLVFVVAAMAGAVDINSVAPGMAAALLCTAAGLGVAIPALFGYNWLASRSEAIAADMAVFVDEFATRLAEEHGDGRATIVMGETAANSAPSGHRTDAPGGGFVASPAAPHRE